jgi:hypothetical protein
VFARVQPQVQDTADLMAVVSGATGTFNNGGAGAFAVPPNVLGVTGNSVVGGGSPLIAISLGAITSNVPPGFACSGTLGFGTTGSGKKIL